ncbi:hypothetical protein KC571_00205 [candidate division WWE3 bacterium]|uniref:Uncharacterized protein n=1 Tax=candidate division WWE3 bacterium TaxID=2053526 RepID=A0A955LFW2_UNCKA|nr:hypothetical protein [candidate division WWE3 bacterium]
MHISEEKIEQFQELYLEQLGKEISKEEAYQQGVKLVRLVKILVQPKQLYDHERNTNDTN